jgi:hypothetical protein
VSHAGKGLLLAVAMAGLAPGAPPAPAQTPGEPAARAVSAAAQPRLVTLRHRPSSFTIRAPRGFTLRVRGGVYVLRAPGRGQSMSFSRSLTGVTPEQFGDALLAQLGGRVAARAARPTQFIARVDRGARRETVVIVRRGDALAVTTASAPRRRPIALATVRRVAASARGGIALQPPPPAQPEAMPLAPYRAPDGGATALVPTQPGWDIQSAGGTIQGSSAHGAFLFGLSMNIFLPQTAPPGTPANILVSPYLGAADALTQVFPRLSPSVSDIQITHVIQEPVLPTFSSSAMYLVSYKVNGQPWTGAATIATDSPDRYGNFVWNMYYSGIGVPVGTDPAVGLGLLRAWKSWDPSGAIAQRTAAAKALMEETNAVWKETMEFRGRIADQQSRDVGCLLQGYYVIEDNARRYDLPPLPCGQVYTERRP